MEVNLSIVSAGDQNVKVSYLGQQKDTINGWLDEHRKLFDGQPQKTCRLIMDSLIRNHQSDIRATLLLRDQIFCLNDSLFVRQILGSIKDEAKPDWMKKSIDNSLKVLGSGKNNITRRLIGASFEAQDTLIDLSASRSDYLLICFWADYSRPSIDSMQALSKLIASKYEQKRVSFLSCCLNSSDSAMWSIRTRFLNGNHTWIKGGFSDSRMRAWDIKEVPSVILLDMYCNQTKRNVWGEELYRALDRLPNRTGFQK